ncbi:hypothetical protein LEP1GSC158_3912 [Leptospira interrogans serovar Zanoni str. LT2156]|uniref:Uncharacterized protein n=1 Tax=Leptospira interrogans serovar Zanoni str. LT2156 TaxID=1001601 RepID=M6HSR5_LEPIR|nr:hypothetical protein LEP1GSC158_3912 [Leptospira interrogans serovar Zanoni str. LT2156]
MIKLTVLNFIGSVTNSKILGMLFLEKFFLNFSYIGLIFNRNR